MLPVAVEHRDIPCCPSEVSNTRPGWNEAPLSLQEHCWQSRCGPGPGCALWCDQLRFSPQPLFSRRVQGGCQSHTVPAVVEVPHFLMAQAPEALGSPLEKVLDLPSSFSPGHCDLSPVQVPWSYPRTNSRWTPASRYLRCCQRRAVRFPLASHHTVMWPGTHTRDTPSSWKHTAALKHQCCLYVWLTRDQTCPAACAFL